jgi:hypothetical protein
MTLHSNLGFLPLGNGIYIYSDLKELIEFFFIFLELQVLISNLGF